jgi:hypothetical protein
MAEAGAGDANGSRGEGDQETCRVAHRFVLRFALNPVTYYVLGVPNSA